MSFADGRVTMAARSSSRNALLHRRLAHVACAQSVCEPPARVPQKSLPKRVRAQTMNAYVDEDRASEHVGRPQYEVAWLWYEAECCSYIAPLVLV